MDYPHLGQFTHSSINVHDSIKGMKLLVVYTYVQADKARDNIIFPLAPCLKQSIQVKLLHTLGSNEEKS